MGWLSRAALLGCLLSSTCGLSAFDLQYGSLFQVKGVSVKDGSPVLPLSRKKYANVRVLDKGTFTWLQTCSPVCKQADAAGEAKVAAIRATKTREGMWIADVAVDEKWLLTFLIFKKGEDVSFVSPEGVDFLDASWLSRVHGLLKACIRPNREEEQHAMCCTSKR